MRKYFFFNIILFSVFLIVSVIVFYNDSRNFLMLEEKFLKEMEAMYNNNVIEENKKLKEVLNLKEKNNFIVVSSKFSCLYSELVINKGSSDSVKKGSVLFNEKGFVGIVKNVKKNYSTVELLENLETKISVKVNNEYGVLTKKGDKLVITGLLSTNMNINDKVYTSGLTNIPENIYVGEIIEIVNKDDIFETEAIISINKDYKYSKYFMVASK